MCSKFVEENYDVVVVVQDMRDVRQHLRVPGLDLRLLFSR